MCIRDRMTAAMSAAQVSAAENTAATPNGGNGGKQTTSGLLKSALSSNISKSKSYCIIYISNQGSLLQNSYAYANTSKW